MSRERLKQQMLRVAAGGWRERGERERRSDRAAWVANRVNKRFGEIRFIQPKWVNQNRDVIEMFLKSEAAPTDVTGAAVGTP